MTENIELSIIRPSLSSADEAETCSNLQLDALNLYADSRTSQRIDGQRVLALQAWELAMLSQRRTSPLDFSGAKLSDMRAQETWMAIDKAITRLNGATLRMEEFALIRQYKDLVSDASKSRLMGKGGLRDQDNPPDIKFKPTLKSYLSTLGQLDPDRKTRTVPVSLPRNQNDPVWVTKDMQLCHLACHTINNPARSIRIGDQRNIKLLDVELAWQAGATFDRQALKILHQNAIEGLEGPDKIFEPNEKYTPADRRRISRQAELGLSEDEVDKLHERLLAAKQMRAHP